MENTGKPKVLISYPGACIDPAKGQDVFVYLRPETNGYLVESCLLSAVKKSDLYDDNIHLVYLANVPGNFIVENNIIERHYRVKLFFAIHGKSSFTPKMQDYFEDYFKIGFDAAPILGSFQALQVLNMSPDELFDVWVSEKDMTFINGQSIKWVRGHYVVNYDIPSLLHRNSRNTDIAVMVFRSTLKRAHFHMLINDIRQSLINHNILDANKPASRVFHFSKGPFEQILDGTGYLFSKDGKFLPFKDISFVRYLLKQGLSEFEIRQILHYPIMDFIKEGRIVEENIFHLTQDMGYHAAFETWGSAISQYIATAIDPDHFLEM